VHHAGLLPRYRRLVESLFERKLLAVAVCTETLAAGINLPARSVILTSLAKGPASGQKLIDASSAQQIFGRAGRPQFDDKGFVYCMAHEDDVRLTRWKRLFEAIPEDTKDPMLLRKRKDLKRKKPEKSEKYLYWTEPQFLQLQQAAPARLYSKGPLPWRLLAYLLELSPEVNKIRSVIRKRLLDSPRIKAGELQLDRMLLALHKGGYVKLEPAPLGDAAGLNEQSPVVVVSGGQAGAVSMARLVSRRPFSGNWEYHIDGAIFTAPARRDHSGAGLFNLRGELVGVGSLVLNNVASTGQPRTAGNLFVPVDLFRPVLEQLQRSGRWAGDTRAWLGVNCTEREGEIWVVRVAEDSPAERAGLAVGDRIVSIDGEAVTELSALWKTLWRGQAEREVTLQVRRHGLVRQVLVRTIDRATTLKQATGV
jgi:hypothetical protein